MFEVFYFDMSGSSSDSASGDVRFRVHAVLSCASGRVRYRVVRLGASSGFQSVVLSCASGLLRLRVRGPVVRPRGGHPALRPRSRRAPRGSSGFASLVPSCCLGDPPPSRPRSRRAPRGSSGFASAVPAPASRPRLPCSEVPPLNSKCFLFRCRTVCAHI